MIQNRFLRQLSGKKFFAVWSVAILLGGLVCFLLVDNVRNRLKLRQEIKQDFLNDTESIAAGLEYFFEERKYDLNTLACSRVVTTYFENRAMGMSEEYGLKASLAGTQESFIYTLKHRKFANLPIYQQLMLIDKNGNILLDCSWSKRQPEHSSNNLYSIFNGKPRSAIIYLENNDCPCVVISVPCYLKENYVATLLAIVNTDSILYQLGNQNTRINKNMLIVDKDSCKPLSSGSSSGKTIALPPKTSSGIAEFKDNAQKPYLCAVAPISNTSLIVINYFSNEYLKTVNPWKMLFASAMAAMVLFGGGILVYHSAAKNLVLQVRLEEQNNQQKSLEAVNQKLEQEVAHRRLNEILLIEKKAHLLATIESTTEGILVVNQNGQIVSWNQSFREIWGFTDILPLAPISEMKDFFLERTQNSPSFINEICYLEQCTDRYDGLLTLKNASVIEYHSRPMKVEDSIRGRVWTFRDITIHKQAEKALQTARDASEKSNKAKTEFLTNMSHELRTPLNSIIGFSSVLSEESLNDSQKMYVENIQKSGLNLLELLDNLLLYSDIEAERITPEVQKCSLWEIIKLARKKIQERIQKKGLHLDVICDRNTPLVFYSDSQMIVKILNALLDNACKFTEQGRIEIAVSLLPREASKWVQIVIEDSGVGIPEDKLHSIFDAFTQVDGSKTRKYGGTGTGLTITKKLIDLLGGEIEIQSEYGKGTTCIVRFPVIEQVDDSPASSQQAQPQTTAAAN